MLGLSWLHELCCGMQNLPGLAQGGWESLLIVTGGNRSYCCSLSKQRRVCLCLVSLQGSESSDTSDGACFLLTLCSLQPCLCSACTLC